MLRRVRLLLRLLTLTGARRPAALALAALLAIGIFSAASPLPARADPLPEFARLTVDPTCEPAPSPDGQVITITVRGYSFQAGRVATIYWDGTPAQAPADAVQVQPSGYIEVTFSVTLLGSASFHALDAYYQDQPPDDSGTVPPVASTSIDVPCPVDRSQISVTPDCGDQGVPLSIHVTGSGFLPDLPTDVKVEGLDETVYASTAQSVPPDPNALAFDVPVTLPATGIYRVVAAQYYPVGVEGFDPLPTATAYFAVPCAQAVLSPTCNVAGSGPDRYSIQVAGTGFQPRIPVGIVFDSTGQAEYFGNSGPVNDDGSFGPVQITPYARGPGTYDVVVTQQNDSPVLHSTHATFTVECPPPESVTLNPTCAVPQFSGDQQQTFQLQVSGGGFQPNLPVTVTFDPDGLSGPTYTPETTQVPADGSGSFAATLNVLARPAGTYRIAVQQQVNGAVIDGSVPPFNVPCAAPSAKITAVRPNCGDDVAINPAPYSVEVIGRGFIPGFVQIVFDFDGSQEQFSTIANANGRIDATITPTARPAGAYRIAAQQADANQLLDQAFAAFGVPCTQTLLTITPGAAAPGFVVSVHGSGFPAGRQIELMWSYGIGATRPIDVTVAPDGTFDRQVLIFAHDFAGERQMTAGTHANPNAFPGAQATLLVSAGQGSPPAYTIFGGDPSDQPPIILRR